MAGVVFSGAKLVVCAMIFLMTDTHVDSLETFYLTDFCGESFSFKHFNVKSILLKLSRNETYPPNMDCDMKVFAPSRHRLMFLFTQINTDDCQDYADVYEFLIDHYNSLDPEVCDVLPGVLSTTWSHGRIGFYSNGNGKGQGRGFTVLVTAFHTDECSSSEFRCDNGRCIDVSLNCSSYNNCGDNSNNKCSGNEVLNMIIQIVFSIFAVGSFVAIFVFWRRARSRFSGGFGSSNNRTCERPGCPEPPSCRRPSCPVCPSCFDPGSFSLPSIFRRNEPPSTSTVISSASTQTFVEAQSPDSNVISSSTVPPLLDPSPPAHRSLMRQRRNSFSDPPPAYTDVQPPAYDDVQPPAYDDVVKKHDPA